MDSYYRSSPGNSWSESMLRVVSFISKGKGFLNVTTASASRPNTTVSVCMGEKVNHVISHMSIVTGTSTVYLIPNNIQKFYLL